MARAPAQTKINPQDTIAAPSRDDFAAMLEQSFQAQSPQEGAVIKGKVVAIENDNAIVDVGLKTEGRVPLKEFAMPGVPANIQVGD
ncbi:MAG: S1 RNA-binding domain-containing protein, partial [Rhizomicrobium sp.]